MGKTLITLEELEERLGPQMAKLTLIAEGARDYWDRSSPGIMELRKAIEMC